MADQDRIDRVADALRRVDYMNWRAAEVAEKIDGTIQFLIREARAEAAGEQVARYERAIEEGHRRAQGLEWCNKPDQCHIRAEGARLVLADIDDVLGRRDAEGEGQ